MADLLPLPGLQFIFKDGGLLPVTPPPTSDTVLIIGTALDGPINTPFALRNLGDLESFFGPVVYKGDYLDPVDGTASKRSSHNSLVRCISEAIQGGAGNIICVRVGGVTAQNVTTTAGSVAIQAKFPGRIYNQVSMAISSGATLTTFALNQPNSKGGNITFTFPNTTTVGAVINSINTDSRNRTLSITVPNSTLNNPVTSIALGTLALSGTTTGTNGTSAPSDDYASNKFGLYTALTQTGGTFDMLANITADVAVLACMYGDEATANNVATATVAQDFANFCYKVSKESQPLHGVVMLRPTGLTNVADLTTFSTNYYEATASGWVDQGSNWMSFGYFMNNGFYYVDADTGENVNVGRHISVFAGPDILVSNPDLGIYRANGGAAYAGLISSLSPADSPTNQYLGSIHALAGDFMKATRQRLNQGIGRNSTTGAVGEAAYVTLRSDNGRPLVEADNSCSNRNSDYRILQISRITNAALKIVKDTLKPFIGRGNSPAAIASMKTRLTTELTRLYDIGALVGGEGSGFTFVILSSPLDRLLNTIRVNLTITPAIEIRQIVVNVNVN